MNSKKFHAANWMAKFSSFSEQTIPVTKLSKLSQLYQAVEAVKLWKIFKFSQSELVNKLSFFPIQTSHVINL